MRLGYRVVSVEKMKGLELGEMMKTSPFYYVQRLRGQFAGFIGYGKDKKKPTHDDEDGWQMLRESESG